MKGSSYIQSVARGTMTERAVLTSVATPADIKSLIVSCSYGNGNEKNIAIADSTIPPFGISATVP